MTVQPLENHIAFGAVTYAGFTGGECPVLQGTEVAPSTNNFESVLALLPAAEDAITETTGHTPTTEGLEAAYGVLDAVGGDAPNYAVLLTDGLPAQCALLGGGVWCGQDPAIAVTQQAHGEGIETFAVGIGLNILGDSGAEAAASDHFLNAVAHAGQGLSVAPFSPEEVLGQALPCIQLEAQAIRDEEVGTDFYSGGWRNYTAATYGPDVETFAQQRYLTPAPEDLETELFELVSNLASCE